MGLLFIVVFFFGVVYGEKFGVVILFRRRGDEF